MRKITLHGINELKGSEKEALIQSSLKWNLKQESELKNSALLKGNSAEEQSRDDERKYFILEIRLSMKIKFLIQLRGR